MHTHNAHAGYTKGHSLVPRPPPFLFFGLHSVKYTEAEYRFRVLYWTQAEERKQKRPGSEAKKVAQKSLFHLHKLSKVIELWSCMAEDYHVSAVSVLVHVGFLHNSKELSLTHFTITILVCFIYHFLNICVCVCVCVERKLTSCYHCLFAVKLNSNYHSVQLQ